MGDTEGGTLEAGSRPETSATSTENWLGPKLVTSNYWCKFVSLAPSASSSATLDVSVSAPCQLRWYVMGAEPANFHTDAVTGAEPFSFQIILPPYGETLAFYVFLDRDAEITVKSMTAFSLS